MAAERLLWVDAIRVAAAQTIVLHHLSIYGPVGDTLRTLLPGLIGWLDDHGRLAVQVFLVMGGWLCFRSLNWAEPLGLRRVGRSIARRWARLFLPFYAALGLVLLASVPGQAWLGGAAWVPGLPDLKTTLAHLFGLFDYLGIEALSAGAWYVAIDFQLHAITLALAWLVSRFASDARGRRTWFLVAVVGLAATSLLWVNRFPNLDFQPVYFFGSFALGMVAGGFSEQASPDYRLAALVLIALTAIALLVDWRIRIALALAVMLAIAAALRGLGAAFDSAFRAYASVTPRPAERWLIFLSDSAYALFLVHFAVCIVANAVFVRFTDGGPITAAIFFVAAWLCSLPIAAALHRAVERPLSMRRGFDERPGAG
ncbi:MAG: acyltransferase family protein [Betaproteobacteria bacterium]|nr:acyltransferase [Betaproteobacteria bacterium]